MVQAVACQGSAELLHGITGAVEMLQAHVDEPYASPCHDVGPFPEMGLAADVVLQQVSRASLGVVGIGIDEKLQALGNGVLQQSCGQEHIGSDDVRSA